MVEVEISRLEYAHDLNTFCGLSVERNACRAHDLCDQSLQCDDIYREVTIVYEIAHAVQQRVHTEQTLLRDRRRLLYVDGDVLDEAQ